MTAFQSHVPHHEAHSPPTLSSSKALFSQALFSLRAKISGDSLPERGSDPTSFLYSDDDEMTLTEEDRSRSRGREGFTSSGRGGAGNIHKSSKSRDARPGIGPDDFSEPRGREPKVDHLKAFATGRGGAGNIRSPSRDVPTRSGPTAVEEEVIHTHIVADHDAVHSHGRGGIGNISRSRSRARDSSSLLTASGVHSRDHSVHSTVHPTAHHPTGRGGAGNIFPGPAPHETDEKELAKKLHEHGDEIHSTGRGGLGNVVHLHVPDVEPAHHEHHRGSYESTGRGGAGNMILEE